MPGKTSRSVKVDSSRALSRKALLASGLQKLAELLVRTVQAYRAGLAEAYPAPALPARRRIRPPGARPEPEFRRRCTWCRDCISACRFDALGPDDEGYPWLRDPAGNPCYMCEGYPCIAACGPAALVFGDRRLRTIGLARIAPDRCLNLQEGGTPGSTSPACAACRDACRETRAIRLEGGSVPAIDPDRCTGCGVCVGKCPAPGGAITLAPR